MYMCIEFAFMCVCGVYVCVRGVYVCVFVYVRCVLTIYSMGVGSLFGMRAHAVVTKVKTGGDGMESTPLPPHGSDTLICTITIPTRIPSV